MKWIKLYKNIVVAGRNVRLFLKREPTPFIYAAIGDSTVEGLGATHPDRSYIGIIAGHLKESGRQIIVHNAGKAGARIGDVNNGQIDSTVEKSPNLITISIGANDIRAHTSPFVFRRQLRHLLLRLTTETKAAIVINNIPDMSLSKQTPKKLRMLIHHYVKLLNKVILQEANRYKIIVVDLFSQSQFFAKNYPEIFSEDGFHPSDFGYAIWANTILPYIQANVRMS